MGTNHWLRSRCPVCCHKLVRSEYHYDPMVLEMPPDITYSCDSGCKMYSVTYFGYPYIEYKINGNSIMFWSNMSESETLRFVGQKMKQIKKAKDKYIEDNGI